MRKQCRICNRDLPIIKHNRQVYCDKELRNCAQIAHRVKTNIQNQQRFIPVPKRCARCLETKTEQGMKKHCKKCLNIIYVRNCITCGIGVSGKKRFCTKCSKKRKGTKTLCITCNLEIPTERSLKAKYC